MPDKKISELDALVSPITGDDISVIVHNGTDYKYEFAQLLQYISANIPTGANFTFVNAIPQNNQGKNNDVAVNISNQSFYQKQNGTWTEVFKFSTNNTPASGIAYGLGEPNAGDGQVNDTYINTVNGKFYQKSLNGWSVVFSMLNGPPGGPGPRGTTGSPGTNGKTILNGNINPSNQTVGTDGDFYINTTTYTIFGPKTNGDWGQGVVIVPEDFDAKADKTYVDTQDNSLKAYIDAGLADVAGVKPGEIDTSLKIENEKLGVNFNEVPTKAEYNALRDALIPHPTYNAPTNTLSANKTITGEIGQTIADVTFNQTFNQRDGGQAYGYQVRKNGTTAAVSTSLTETIVLTASAVSYQGAVFYYDGETKNNILGMPDATGKILAGTALSNILQAIGYNATWYGATDAAPADSVAVRALQTYNTSNQLISGRQLTNAGNSFTHRTGTINKVHVIVTAPGKSLSAVVDQDALNKDITDEYVYTGTMSVNNAAGIATAGYKLYIKTMGVAYTTSHRHLITLI